MATQQTNGSRWRWPLTIGFVVACAILAALMGGSLWQSSVADSKEDDAQAYQTRATLLQEAGVEGQAAAELLQTYVEQGDASLLPQIDEHSTTGLQKLTTALSQGGASDVAVIVDTASGLVDGVAQVVTLRQSGDAAGAAAALDQMSSEFEELTDTQTAAITAEQEAAAVAQSDADSADDTAGSLRVSAFALAACIVLTALVILGRSLMVRRASKRASTT